MKNRIKPFTVLALLFVVSVSAGVLIRKATANSKAKETKLASRETVRLFPFSSSSLLPKAVPVVRLPTRFWQR